VTILDWATRKVLAWRLSNTLDAIFCVEALKEAIAKYGKSEIMNTASKDHNSLGQPGSQPRPRLASKFSPNIQPMQRTVLEHTLMLSDFTDFVTYLAVDSYI